MCVKLQPQSNNKIPGSQQEKSKQNDRITSNGCFGTDTGKEQYLRLCPRYNILSAIRITRILYTGIRFVLYFQTVLVSIFIFFFLFLQVESFIVPPSYTHTHTHIVRI